MPPTDLFSGSIPILEKAMNLRSTRHNVLSSNVANMDTPNYKAFEVHVEEALQAQSENSRKLPMKQTHANHMPLQSHSRNNLIVESRSSSNFSLRADGNTVDIDETMGKMAENTIKYKTAAQMIAKKFRGLKNAIQGGK